jgi:hypothetical protein
MIDWGHFKPWFFCCICSKDLVLDQYSIERVPDAHAICDLAMYNFIEVNNFTLFNLFELKKRLEFISIKDATLGNNKAIQIQKNA